jgi:type IV pilus assembly protein PilM
MSLQPGVWGIDIGQCALKAIRLQIIDNKVTATAFDYVEHPKILSQPDADPDALTKEALEKFLSRNPIKGDKVAIGVPGQSGLARFVKLPPVEEKKISDIVKFEAKQQIPFPLEEVVWDYQKVSEGTVEGGFAIDTEIGLFAMKRDMINRFLNHFAGVKVEVHYVQMAPLALCNYITYDFLKRGGPDGDVSPLPTVGKKKCFVALDIGTDSSSLIITDGGKIIWQRPIPLGGNHFTRSLTKEMKLTFAKAEHLKRNAAKSPELANILKALKPVLTDFVGEVQRSLGYFTNTHRDAHIEAMVGLGSAFKLPGLQKYLGDKLQLKVEKPSKFARIVGDAVTASPVFMENVLTFPVAYGLALQALSIARIGTNLLPPEITLDRQIRAKKPWAVAAAASLLLGTAVMAWGYSIPYAAVNNEAIGKSLEEGKK